jgi:hypothetical protein
LYFDVCEFNLYSDDAFVYKKPSTTGSQKKTIKPTTASQIVLPIITALIPPSAGITGPTTLSPAKAWDHYRWATEFLEDLKNREADREGRPFPPLLPFPSDFFH